MIDTLNELTDQRHAHIERVMREVLEEGRPWNDDDHAEWDRLDKAIADASARARDCIFAANRRAPRAG